MIVVRPELLPSWGGGFYRASSDGKSRRGSCDQAGWFCSHHDSLGPIASPGSPTHWNRQSTANFYQPRYPFDIKGSVSLRTGGVTTASRSSQRPFLNQLVSRPSKAKKKALKVAENPLPHPLPSSYLAARRSLKSVTQSTSFLLKPNS